MHLAAIPKHKTVRPELHRIFNSLPILVDKEKVTAPCQVPLIIAMQ